MAGPRLIRSDTPEPRRSRPEIYFEQRGENRYHETDLIRHHSTRGLSKELTERQHPASKLAVHWCLETNLKLKPLRLRMQPRLSVDRKRRRLDFAKAHKKTRFWVRGWGRGVRDDQW